MFASSAARYAWQFSRSFASGLLTVLLASTATAEDAWPMATWPRATANDVGMEESILNLARDYALTGGGSGYITRHGKLVMAWGDEEKLYDLKSTTKSIGVTALGLAIADRKIQLQDRVLQHHPAFGVPPESNRDTAWLEKITIQHLATQTAGFEKPGGYRKLLFEPGTKWLYSDGGPNWLAECVTLVYRRDVNELMFERVFAPLGIKRSDLVWRNNQYREKQIDGIPRREFGSGVSANVGAMARIGYLYLRNGQWRAEQIIPGDFVKLASHPVSSVVGLPEVDAKDHGNASDHYGLLWWNNADGTLKNIPRDAFWSWGLYDSLILVIPSMDIVVSRAGKSWKRESSGHYDVLSPFFDAIVAATVRPSGSPIIKGIRWAPVSTIIRRAHGGDNWPITWGDDGNLYTAYGDGRGFEPFVEKKLSMGLSRVTGDPQIFTGVNLRSSTAEKIGGGKSGPKVSGMLMVDGVLYMLVRNTNNAQLAQSRDRGRTWEWAEWKFTTSFGYPTFLNFGSDYAGARDEFVYIYSHDSDSAYERTDAMVLARVPAKQIANREAYEFFQELEDSSPVWTRDIDKRGAVFTSPGLCYRSSVSYNAPLKRYLWCQTGAGEDTRFAGGLAIYDAPEPWGPWTTAFSTSNWDVGPGETSCLPTKWMSQDGRTVHLVFSGDDSFSVRQGQLLLE